ncbi:MAG: hypothetical protein A3G76_00685 [Acidobacteria bacterium RIFCSPLOWO2_12_FULL_65_11]|nr:MAG: hypothetical protein A3H95_07575 [Acidobacteria bacterium RIFCSPLOWO2_02_FULL_64_15]OFW34610.1 MAG: hypothetical protein A3G76_00685 [Acidobacteria bacterium RIFCSPLOWO2_12_FULL_65_11]
MKRHYLQGIPLLLLLSACASYAVRTVPINVPTAYPNKSIVGELTFVADVYGTAAKYRSVFDTIPSYERGYLGVNLIFFNDSGNTVSVDPSAITCTTRSGTIIDHVPATQVAEQVLRSTTGRYFAGGVIAAGSSKGANDRIRGDFAAKALKARDLPPGSRSQGFVFFSNVEPLQTLTIRGIRNAGDGTSIAVDISMPIIPLYRPVS